MKKEFEHAQTIEIVSFVKAVRKAIDAGTIGAQKGRTDCLYEYADGSTCIIGAGLNPQLRQELVMTNYNSENVNAIEEARIVELPADYREELIALQELHDAASDQAGLDAMYEAFALLELQVQQEYPEEFQDIKTPEIHIS